MHEACYFRFELPVLSWEKRVTDHVVRETTPYKSSNSELASHLKPLALHVAQKGASELLSHNYPFCPKLKNERIHSEPTATC